MERLWKKVALGSAFALAVAGCNESPRVARKIEQPQPNISGQCAPILLLPEEQKIVETLHIPVIGCENEAAANRYVAKHKKENVVIKIVPVI